MNRICIVAVDIRSVHNVGSLLRTADGFNAEVILCGISPRPKKLENEDRLPHVIEKAHTAISKTALGAENTVKTSYFKTASGAIDYLKDESYKVYALEQSNKSKSILELNPVGNTAILVGPEVEGVSDKIINMCDGIYEIPMNGEKESFNVSVAAGIALYQARMHDFKNMIK